MASSFKIIINGQNNSGPALREATSDVRALGTTAQQASGSVGGFFSSLMASAGGFLAANIIGGIAGQVSQLAGSMIGGNAAFEQYGVRFATLLGSAELAKERMAELATFGANTPFELPGVVEADTILQGFGLHAADAASKFGFSGEQIRTIAGDVASGTGASFQEMALLIGKFSAGATGEAIARMMELGITSRAELTDLGLQFSKSGELLSPLPQSMEVVLAMMQDKYGGLMQAQATTFSGMASNLADWMGNAARTVGAPIFDVLKGSLQQLLVTIQNPAIMAGLTSIGQFLAGQLSSAINFVANTAIPALVNAWNMVSPAVAAVAQALQTLWGIFSGLASAAMGWGQNIAIQLGNGIMAGAGAVIDSLGYIGDLITYYLEPHSPPKLLPDLDKWGADAASVYMDGWTDGDFSAFNKLGQLIESSLKSMVDLGGLPKEGLVPALIGGRNAIAAAIDELARTGTVAESTYATIRQVAGDAGAEIEAVTRLMVEQAQASQAVSEAQRELTATTAAYDAVLDPLEAQLAALESQEQALANQQKMAYLQEIANSDLTDSADKERAQQEILEIQLREKIRATKEERATAIDSAEAKLKAAKAEEARVAKELATAEQKVQAQEEYNQLIRQQIQLMEQMKAKSGGGGGGGGMDQAAKDAERAAKAMRDYEMSVASTDEKLAMLKAEQAKYTQQDEEYWQLQRQIEQTESQRQRELDELAQAQTDYAYSIADTDGKLKQLKDQQSQYTEGSKEWYELQGKINQLEAQKARELESSRKEAESSTRAQRDFNYATADTAGKIAMLRSELAGLSPDQEEYWQKKTQLAQLEQQYAKELEGSSKALKGAGGAAKGAAGGIGALGAGIGGLTPKIGGLIPKLDETKSKADQSRDSFRDMKDAMLDSRDSAEELNPAMTRAHAVLATLHKIFDPIIQRVRQLSIVIREFGPGALQEIQAFVTGTGDSFAHLHVIQTYIGSMFDGVGAKIGTAVRKMGADLKAAFNRIDWGNIFSSLPGRIVLALTTIFGAISVGPLIVGLFAGIGPALGGITAALGPVGVLFTAILSPIGTLVRAGLVPFASLITQIGTLLIGWGGYFSAATGWIGGLAGGFMSLLAPLAPLVGWLAPLGGYFAGLVGPLAAVLGPLLGAIAPFIAIGAAIALLLNQTPQLKAALEGWVTQFGQWALDAIPVMFGALNTLLGQLLTWIGEQAPGVIATLVQWSHALFNWVLEAIPLLLDGLANVLGTILMFIVEHGPDIIADLLAWGASFVGWIIDALPQLGSNLGTFLGKILGWIGEAIVVLVPKLVELAGKFVAWVVTDVIPALPGALANISEGIFNFLASLMEQLTPKIIELATKFYSWITETVIPNITTGLNMAWESISGWFAATLGKAASKGKELGQSIVDGISNAFGSLKGTMWTIVKSAINPVISSINGLIDGINAVSGALGIDPIGHLPMLAMGTNNFAGGMAILGDGGGPELALMPGGSMSLFGTRGSEQAYLPRGTRVFTSTQTRAMQSGGGGMGAGTSGGAGGGQVIRIIEKHLHIHTNAPTENIVHDFDLMDNIGTQRS